MAITQNAEQALDSSREGIESIIRWVVLNQDQLPIGLGVAGAIVLLMLGFRALGAWLAAGDPDCLHWRGVIGRVLGKTSILFMVAAAIDIVVTYSAVPRRIERIGDILFVIAFALQGAVWARELVLGLIGRRAREDEGEGAISNAMALIKVLVSIALFAIAFIVILDNLGVNVTALVAGLGIGGIAIGLAAQGIFSDLFAALSILFDKPFRRGDTIRYGQSVGTVERIGLKTTRLRSLDGQQLVMANTKLLEQEISNFAEGNSRRTTMAFGVIYQTTPEQLEEVPELVSGVIKSRSGCSFVRCAITGFGTSSIDFELLFDSASTDMDIVGADRTSIVANIMRVFALHGIEFAYPTQTTFTAAPDGTMIMPYPQVQPVRSVEKDEGTRATKRQA